MWEPMCLRMQMLLFHTRGDGLCNGEQKQHAERKGMRQPPHHKPVCDFITEAENRNLIASDTVTVCI